MSDTKNGLFQILCLFEFDLYPPDFRIDLRANRDPPGVVSDPDYPAALSFDQAARSKDVGLDSKTPDLSEDRFLSFTGGYFYRNAVYKSRIADRSFKCLSDS